MLINGSTRGMPLYAGVMVLYADDESFMVMTVDTTLQWSRVGNVRHNAGARSIIYTMADPGRWVRSRSR